MKLEEFVSLVQEMRQAQKDYFTLRSYKSLKRAKALEKRVDKEAANIIHSILSDGTEQLSFCFQP